MKLPIKYRWAIVEVSYHIKFLLRKLLPKPLPKLCTVTFLYDVKGVVGAGKNKRDTIFAWIEHDATSHDCVQFFDPPGIGKGQCVVKDVIVMVIPTVKKNTDE